MTKPQFNLSALLLDQRLTVEQLAGKTGAHIDSIYKMIRRGTIKVSFLDTLESHFGDCSKYIIKQQNKNAKSKKVA